jgi:hypothetical protein
MVFVDTASRIVYFSCRIARPRRPPGSPFLSSRVGRPCLFCQGTVRLFCRDSGGWGNGVGLEEGAVAERREEHVGTAGGKTRRGVLVPSLLDLLPLAAGPGCRVGQRGERGGEEGPFEVSAASVGGAVAEDRCPRPGTVAGERWTARPAFCEPAA